MECTGFSKLTEGCVSTILSLTSPLDACKSSPVSSIFRAAAESDVVWERFLPANYQDRVLPRLADQPLMVSSKKDLFMRLCDSTPIDGGNKRIRLEKWSGKISYLLSARELSIACSHDPTCWSWTSIPESRFLEVAELKRVRRLEIEGKIRSQMLSPNTKYGAYLIIKISKKAFGLDLLPSEISVQELLSNNSINDHVLNQNGTAYLIRCCSNHDRDTKKKKKMMMMKMEKLFCGNSREMLKMRRSIEVVPREREDGWLEVELGDFFVNGDDDDDEDKELKMSLKEVMGDHLKGGLIIEGIEVRPYDDINDF